MNQPRELQVRWVLEEEEFAALQSCWDVLAEATDPADLFLRHAWFDAAWQWARASAELRVLVVTREATTVGIVPLMRTQRGRRIEFLTVPDTQSCGVLASDADIEAVVAAFGQALADGRGDWCSLVLRYLNRTSPRTAMLAAALGSAGMPADLMEAGANTYVDLTGTWNAYYGTRGRRLKKSVNLVANRIGRAGTVRAMNTGQDGLDPASALEAAIRISAESWKADLGVSLDRPGPAAFIRRLTSRAVEKGWLSIWLLALDGTYIAMEYQLRYRGRIHALRSDFRRETEPLSPGTHLNRVLLERLFGQGDVRYLMGPGNNAYKRKWTNLELPLAELRAFSPALSGRAAALVERQLKRWGRAARHRVYSWRKPAPSSAANEELE